MKKHNVILVISFAGIAAFFLKETFQLKEQETILAEELELLRSAAAKSPSTNRKLTPNQRSLAAQAQAKESAKFVDDLVSLLKNGVNQERIGAITAFSKGKEELLDSAPSSKLRDLCDSLEADFSAPGNDAQLIRHVWTRMLGKVARSDPDWAMAKFDAAAVGKPIESIIKVYQNWPSDSGEAMSLSYAGALKRWLDKAEAEGRIGDDSALVKKLRADLASAEGNLSAASKELSSLPYSSQRDAVYAYVGKLTTSEERRQALEELSSTLQFQNYQVFASSLSHKEGFEAAREILGTASLTPENHDLAAASIASAKIGPETKEHAAWLWENLKSGDSRALENFAQNWSKGDHPAAAAWLNTLPKGEKRDAALKGFIPTTAIIDGATAMDWALSISQPSLRSWMYDVAYRKWKESDPARAEAYRQAKPLNAEAQPTKP